MELNNQEKFWLELAASAEAMAGTDFWKRLVKAMAAHEANALVQLEQYLEKEEHPDREEVMTLCLKWDARRSFRRLLLANVEEAKSYRGRMKDQIMQQYMTNPEQPVSDEVAALMMETGL